MGMWPVPYESATVQATGRSFISCYTQPMLIMHGSLDVQSLPAGYVDNLGTISSSNGAVATVFQQNAGHTVFYTASACVWMYLQQLASRNFVSAGTCSVVSCWPDLTLLQGFCPPAKRLSTSTGTLATPQSSRPIDSGRMGPHAILCRAHV